MRYKRIIWRVLYPGVVPCLWNGNLAHENLREAHSQAAHRHANQPANKIRPPQHTTSTGRHSLYTFVVSHMVWPLVIWCCKNLSNTCLLYMCPCTICKHTSLVQATSVKVNSVLYTAAKVNLQFLLSISVYRLQI